MYKNTRFKHFVKQSLKEADNIDQRAEEIWSEHKSQEALDLITDLYILQKEQNIGNHNEKRKEYYYEVSYSGQPKKTIWDIANKLYDNRRVDE